MFGCTCVGVWTHHASTSGIASQHLLISVVETGPVIDLELLDSVGVKELASEPQGSACLRLPRMEGRNRTGIQARVC